MKNYDTYNREERNICAHLFRLLHEKKTKSGRLPIQQFIHCIDPTQKIHDFDNNEIKIFCEVALIRDFYHKIKQNVSDFMNKLTKKIMQQENINADCRLFSELPDELNNPSHTHPKQIKQKAIENGFQLMENEMLVYGVMQEMFNAKPDLAIAYDDTLYSIEVKFTESFDVEQFNRTKRITDVWISLLHEEFGFQNIPKCRLIKIGARKFNPDVTWSQIFEIAKSTYEEKNRTYIAIAEGAKLLVSKKME